MTSELEAERKYSVHFRQQLQEQIDAKQALLREYHQEVAESASLRQQLAEAEGKFDGEREVARIATEGLTIALDQLKAMQRQLAEAREALEMYGEHADHCVEQGSYDMSAGKQFTCSCGYARALAAGGGGKA